MKDTIEQKTVKSQRALLAMDFCKQSQIQQGDVCICRSTTFITLKRKANWLVFFGKKLFSFFFQEKNQSLHNNAISHYVFSIKLLTQIYKKNNSIKRRKLLGMLV